MLTLLSLKNQYILVNLLMQANLENQFAMAGMCIVAIINICTYHLYVKINEACSQEIEQITMQQQIIMYRHQFDLIEQSELDLSLNFQQHFVPHPFQQTLSIQYFLLPHQRIL